MLKKIRWLSLSDFFINKVHTAQNMPEYGFSLTPNFPLGQNQRKYQNVSYTAKYGSEKT